MAAMKRIYTYVLFAVAAVACGDNAAPAASSPDVLTKTTAEPDGANCQYGGTRVDVGVDKNGNGVLDSGEIQSTFYVCNQASTPAPPDPLSSLYFGDLVIGSAGDVAAAQAYTGIVGNLSIALQEDTAPLAVALPNLQFVSGQISDCSAGLGSVDQSVALSFASLTQVGSDFELQCRNEVVSVDAPVLTAVHGSLLLFGDKLSSWSAPTLATVGRSIIVVETSLSTLTLPMPGTGWEDQLVVEGNSHLDDCATDDLAGAERREGFRGTIAVDGNGSAPCADPTHTCQLLTIGGNATDWRECYQQYDWSSARSTCQSIGAGWDLAYFTSVADEESVGALTYEATYWIGYDQVGSNAPYTWVQEPANQTFAPQSSSDPTNGAFWNSGEPTGDQNPDCVEIFSRDVSDPTAVVANDLPCSNMLRPLCRYLP
jgi:hypothetical protein